MRLQWSEIRARAAAFAAKYADAKRERAETQSFYNDFFDCFGVNRRQVATYEARVRNLPGDRQGFIDLFWPGTLIVEQKSTGRDLRAAGNQALDYYDWLPAPQRPRYILTCDFQRWLLLDLETGREWAFRLAELKDHVEAFAFILGVQPRLNRQQSPANAAASRLMGRLHEALAATNYVGHDLEVLLTRLLFILFADDTRIFNNKDQFLDFLERKTAPDGTDLGRWLGDLFEVLNTRPDRRQSTLDADLAEFPYVNGRLFAERIRLPAFDGAMRTLLIDASAFNWGEVSPAIFGGLFESVIDTVTRRRKGAHYTPEEAILRLIGPLFLDELRAELARARGLRSGRDAALARLHDRLAGLRFLDPACGAGNFLVVTYRELRELERELLKERYPPTGRAPDDGMDAGKLTRLNVDQFFGIEIDEFPARIAEVALWMTDHIANVRLGDDYGEAYARIPLVAAPGIRHADALELDWNAVLPAERCSYVLGNPPFSGFVFRGQAQQEQTARLFAQLGATGSRLDYVAAWFLKFAHYAVAGRAETAFVGTNSIAQGEQVAQLWPAMFRMGMEIYFAHRSFVWPGRAAVHCVIVGFGPRATEPAQKRLFSYVGGRGQPVETQHNELTPYLFDSAGADRHLVVRRERTSLCGAPLITVGTKPVNGGHLIFNEAEFAIFLQEEPKAGALLRPFIGGEEFINNSARWLLHAQAATPATLRSLPSVMRRLAAVRAYRESGGALAQTLAAQPAAYHVTVVPDAPYLVIPEVSSERREYVPIGWVEPPVIPSNQLLVIQNATLFHFGVLTSQLHMSWLRHIGGPLESRYRYSSGLVYNTFPWPDATPAQRKAIEARAQAVLDARALPRNATSSLADLYDPNTMPPELRRAHQALDLAVDRLYRRAPFVSDRERVEHLFPLYEALVQPTAAAPRENRRVARRRAREAAAE